MSLLEIMTSGSGPHWTYDEKVICNEIEALPVEFAASPDASRVAIILYYPGYYQVVVDGQKGERWQTIKQGCLVFSPDSRHVVYAAERQGKPIVVFDDEVLWGYGELTSKPVFSMDSKHSAFITEHNRGQQLVVDGKVGRLCEGIGDDDPVFSPASDRLAYTEMSSRGCSVAVLADLKEPTLVTEGEPFDGIARGTPIFSPDGERIAYVAGKDGKFIVVIDGEKSDPYDSVFEGSLCFSADSKHCVYAARCGDETLFIVDGYVISIYGDVFVRKFCIDKDFSHIAYVIEEKDQQVLVLDEQHIYRYSEIGHLLYSPDSAHLACVARDPSTGQESVVVDGISGPQFKRIVKPGIAFSPDSRHLVYTVQLSNGEESLIVNHDVVCTFHQICNRDEVYFRDNASVQLVVVKEGTVRQLTAHQA